MAVPALGRTRVGAARRSPTALIATGVRILAVLLRQVLWLADEAAPYGVVVKAMAAARRAGATRLGIVTEEEH